MESALPEIAAATCTPVLSFTVRVNVLHFQKSILPTLLRLTSSFLLIVFKVTVCVFANVYVCDKCRSVGCDLIYQPFFIMCLAAVIKLNLLFVFLKWGPPYSM